MMNQSNDDERTALLFPQPQTEAHENLSKIHDRRFIRIWLLILVVLIDFSAFISLPGQFAIIEKIICDQYTVSLNGTNPPGEPPQANPCKSKSVQSELGTMLGWKDTFEMIPGLVFGIPWGLLGDRWGRVPVLFCSVFGLVLTELVVRIITYWPTIFALRNIWYVQFLTVFGGGSTVAQSMVFTMIADITQPAERADFFMMVTASVLFSELIATPVGDLLVETFNPWVPFLVSPILLALNSLLIWILPETLPRKVRDFHEHNRGIVSSTTEHLRSFFSWNYLQQVSQGLRHAPQLLWQNLTLTTLVSISFVGLLSRQSTNFVVIYASKRFGWSIARATTLSTFRSLTQLVTLVLLLPAITHVLQKYGFSTRRKDLVLLRLQACLIAVGAILMAFSGNIGALILGLIVAALGAGFTVNARSLAVTLVRRQHFAALNTALALSASAGVMVAGPLLAAMWNRGLQLDGPWLGLPLLLVGGLFTVVAVVTWTLRVNEEDSNSNEGNNQVNPNDNGAEGIEGNDIEEAALPRTDRS